MNDKRGTGREERGREKCGGCSKEQRRSDRKGDREETQHRGKTKEEGMNGGKRQEEKKEE